MVRSGGPAEFEIRYVSPDGKDMTWTGSGSVGINYEAEYGDIGYGMDSRPIKTSENITVTLDNVQNLKGTARIRRENVERVTTSRTIKVSDYTFGSVAAARKRAGAPKEATFELKTQPAKDYSLREDKVIVFTWDEVL